MSIMAGMERPRVGVSSCLLGALVRFNGGHKRHRLISKPKQMKRKARGTKTLEKGDANLVLTYMPYMRG